LHLTNEVDLTCFSVRNESHFLPLQLLDDGHHDLDQVHLGRTQVQGVVGLDPVDWGHVGGQVRNVQGRTDGPEALIDGGERAAENSNNPKQTKEISLNDCLHSIRTKSTAQIKFD
jgi:hypothetical protein